jgi:hypothetical protein
VIICSIVIQKCGCKPINLFFSFFLQLTFGVGNHSSCVCMDDVSYDEYAHFDFSFVFQRHCLYSVPVISQSCLQTKNRFYLNISFLPLDRWAIVYLAQWHPLVNPVLSESS